MSHNLSRPPWKQCALLLILLSHAVFGSPIVPAINSNYEHLEPASQADVSGPKSVQVSQLSLHKLNVPFTLSRSLLSKFLFLISCTVFIPF